VEALKEEIVALQTALGVGSESSTSAGSDGGGEEDGAGASAGAGGDAGAGSEEGGASGDDEATQLRKQRLKEAQVCVCCEWCMHTLFVCVDCRWWWRYVAAAGGWLTVSVSFCFCSALCVPCMVPTRRSWRNGWQLWKKPARKPLRMVEHAVVPFGAWKGPRAMRFFSCVVRCDATCFDVTTPILTADSGVCVCA